MTNWREYWVYEEIKDLYNIEVTDNSVEIRFQDDNSLYAGFTFEYNEDVEEYIIRDDSGEMLNNSMESTTTYDEVVCSCFYYFYSRY